MLSDVFRDLDLSVFPTVGMIFFIVAFVAISWRALRCPRSDMHDAASLPLHDSDPIRPKGD